MLNELITYSIIKDAENYRLSDGIRESIIKSLQRGSKYGTQE